MVDEVVPPGDDAGAAVFAAAMAMASDLVGIEPAELDGRKISRMPPPDADRAVLDKWMAHVQEARFGEPAPINIVKSVEASCTSDSFAAGVAQEGKNMQPLMGSPEAFALRHLFFSERAYLRGGDSAAPVESLIEAIAVQDSGGPSSVAVPVGATESEVEGLLFPVVNDALALLAANPAASTDDIDVAYTQAYGFPRYLVSLFCTAPATRRLLAYLAYEYLASYLASGSQHRNVCWAGRADVVVGETGAAAREGGPGGRGRRRDRGPCRGRGEPR